MNSVLNNVLTNAIQFSYSSVEIQFTAEDGGDRVFLHVQDFGIGIREEYLNEGQDGKAGSAGTRGDSVFRYLSS